MSIAASECRRAQALLRQGKSMTEGASATVIVCAATHQQLLTIMVGLLVFFGWQFGGLS